MNFVPALRMLYEFLLLMHPPSFRRRFGSEMLWIFEEAAKSESAFSLFFDGFVSLARQWVLRSGSWKIAAALVGAVVELALVGMMLLPHGDLRRNANPKPPVHHVAAGKARR